MTNKWIEYVKEYASKNGISFRDALRDPKCKEGYRKGGIKKTMKGGALVSELKYSFWNMPESRNLANFFLSTLRQQRQETEGVLDLVSDMVEEYFYNLGRDSDVSFEEFFKQAERIVIDWTGARVKNLRTDDNIDERPRKRK